MSNPKFVSTIISIIFSVFAAYSANADPFGHALKKLTEISEGQEFSGEGWIFLDDAYALTDEVYLLTSEDYYRTKPQVDRDTFKKIETCASELDNFDAVWDRTLTNKHPCFVTFKAAYYFEYWNDAMNRPGSRPAGMLRYGVELWNVEFPNKN